jgi:glutamate carboxypeptidase
VSWRGGGEPQVLILGHHDTVFPLGTLARRPFEINGGRVRGPGVFDMLGGLVQAVHGLATLDDLSGVEILVTADEEVGSGSSRGLLEERALACGAVLVMEGAAEGGAVKTGRKGCGTFEVSITGLAAHAGLEPEAGVNALVEAAHQVFGIVELSRPELGTTVTPTVASSGTGENVVPAEAVITVDVRVTTAEEKERVESAFAALGPHLERATITVHGAVDRPPMPTSASAELFALAHALLPGLVGASVGGGSDATSPLRSASLPSMVSERSGAALTPTTSTCGSTRWPSEPNSSRLSPTRSGPPACEQPGPIARAFRHNALVVTPGATRTRSPHRSPDDVALRTRRGTLRACRRRCPSESSAPTSPSCSMRWLTVVNT